MATITKDTIVGDILDIAPETAPAFIDIGMHCLAAPPPGTRLWSRLAWSTSQPVESWWKSSTRSSWQTGSETKKRSRFRSRFLWKEE